MTPATTAAQPAPVDELLQNEGGGIAEGLTYVSRSRIASHLTNVLTSLVMPIDKLDFYDAEHAEDR